MSSTREVLSISSITLKDACELGLSVETINPVNLKDEDKSFLGRFLNESVSSGNYYLGRGPWEVNIAGIDGVKRRRCIHFTAPIVLRPSASYVTHLRAEVMGPQIGSGSYGKVYKALGTLVVQDNGDVAVKMRPRIIKEQSHRKTVIRAVERESEMGIQAGYLHMKMPVHASHASYTASRYFVDTVELFDVINHFYRRHDAYPTDKILRIMRNLLLAVKSQLHDRGIVSRDIKPENILVQLTTEEVVNIDLGLSCLISECHQYESVGSLGYLAPEVFSKSGMTVKSDIFSLGVTISLLLGALPNDDELKSNGKSAVTLPDLTHLFDNVPDLNIADRAVLRAMLQSMMAINPDDRMPLNKAIAIVEDIVVKRQLAAMPESIRADLNQAYVLAVMIRGDLDLAEMAMDAYSSMDPLVVMDALTDKLKAIASGGLELLPDHPEAIKLFAMTLQCKRFSTLTTKAAIQAAIAADIAGYTAKKAAFEACRRELASRLDGDRSQREEFVMAQQELGLIMTALHYRVRSLAPIIDHLPVLTHKLDKSIQELHRLHTYLDEGVSAGGNFGKKLINIGLFRPPLEQFRAGGQGRDGCIPMKNIYLNYI